MRQCSSNIISNCKNYIFKNRKEIKEKISIQQTTRILISMMNYSDDIRVMLAAKKSESCLTQRQRINVMQGLK